MTTMAQDSSVFHIIMFSFSGSKTAGEVFKQLKDANKHKGYDIVAQAIVERDLSGKVHVHEPGTGGVGTTVGVITGGVLGALFSPLAVVALAVTGGTVGGITGYFAGRVIPAEDLKRLGAALPINSSAFVVMVEDTQAEKVLDSMKEFSNANVVTVTVGDELSGEIAQYIAGDVTYTPSVEAQSSASPAQSSTPTEQSSAPPAESKPDAPTQ